MEKIQSISKKLLYSMLFAAIVSVGLLGCLWTYQQYVGFKSESSELRKAMLDNYQNILETEVQRAVDYIEYRKSLTEEKLRHSIQERIYEVHALALHLYEKWEGAISTKEIQNLIIESIRPIRFNNGRGYFFILDLNGIGQLRGDRPELEAMNMLAIPESQEAQVARDIIKLAEKQDEGFYQYDWSKPDTAGKFPKIAFVKLFKPYNWIIGTGEYLEDFEDNIKTEVLSYIGKIKFGRAGYIFVTQWDGQDLTGPAKGRNMIHVTDVNGVKIVQELIALAKSGGGFLRYVMPKFPGLKPDPKLSYVKGIREWQWYVGAGVYIDDIEKAIETKRAELSAKVTKSLIQVLAVLIGVMIFAFLYGQKIAKKTEVNFKHFNEFFAKGASQSVFIDPDKMTYKEIKNLAFSANQMIEARIQAQEQLQENKDWLQSILDSIQAGVIVIDPGKHTILDLNRAAAQMIGVTKDQLVNTICHNHICPNEIGKCPVTDLGQPIEQSDRELIRVDGSRIPILKTVNRAIINGEEYLIESFLDLSEKKTLELMLQQAQKMEAIGTLAGGIAHDFNNILSPIMAYSEMAMIDLSADSPIHRYCQQINQAAVRAKELVKQILTFARSGEENRVPVKLSLIVAEALKFIRSTIPSTIKMEYECDTEQDFVLADPTQMNQIVINLCANATHAMREKGGVLKIKLQDEFVGQYANSNFENLQSGHYLRLTVSDSGPGIPFNIVDKIFDPYFTTKKPGEGTGLGLAVVQGIVKNYGGNITVQSKSDKGTTFIILLPTTRANIAPIPEKTPQLPKGKERIFIVDDEKATIEPIQLVLERLGYIVTSRTSSIEALEAFQQQPYNFDLVITDMTMPYMTGKELAKELIKIRPDVPIILYTGFSEQINQKEAIEMGFSAFLMKPVSAQDLAISIRELLDKDDTKEN